MSGTFIAVVAGLVAVGVVWLALMVGICAALLAEALPHRRRRERRGAERAARARRVVERSPAPKGASARPIPG
jgi:hypothetical protein